MKPTTTTGASHKTIAKYSYRTSVRIAAKRYGVSPGKVDYARKKFPLTSPSALPTTPPEGASSVGLPAEPNPIVPAPKPKKRPMKKAARSAAIKAALTACLPAPENPGDPPAEIPPIWIRAAECKRMMTANKQQATLLKVEIGFQLLGAKEALGHGKWLEQLRLYCPLTIKTAERYMGLAENCIPAEYRKFDNLSNSTPLSLSPEGRSKMQETIGGRSTQRLYEDFGMVKKKEVKKAISVNMVEMAITEMCKRLESLKKHPDPQVAEEAGKRHVTLMSAISTIKEADVFIKRNASDSKSEATTN